MGKVTKDGLIKERLCYSICSKDYLIDYLENKAKEGYMLEKVVGTAYYFRKTEPCDVKYAVELFGKASYYDSIPAKSTEEYIEYCKEAGWEYACGNGKMQIFYSKDKDIVDIETDSKIELKNINRHVLLPNLFYVLYYPIFMAIFNIFSLFQTPYYYSLVDIFIKLSNTLKMVYLFLGLAFCLQLIKCISFNKMNKTRVACGEKLIYFDSRVEKTYTTSLIILLIAYIISFIFFGILENGLITVVSIPILIVLGIVIMIENNRKLNSKMTRKGNMATSMVVAIVASYVIMALSVGLVLINVNTSIDMSGRTKKITYIDLEDNKEKTETIYQDKIPLTSKDLGCVHKETEFVESFCDVYQTVFGKFYECEEFQSNKNFLGVGEDLRYEILKTRFDFIKDSYVKMLIKHTERDTYVKESKKDAAKWNVDKVYYLSYKGDEKTEYYDYAIIVYDDMVLKIHITSKEFIEENINEIKNIIDAKI